mgnify:CR=1 FL=1
MTTNDLTTQLQKVESLYASEFRNGLTLFFISPAWLVLGVQLRNLLNNEAISKASVIIVMFSGIMFSYLSIYYVLGSFSVYNKRLTDIMNSPTYLPKKLKYGVLWRFRKHVTYVFLVLVFLLNILWILITIQVAF